MSTTQQVTFGGLEVIGPWAQPYGDPLKIELAVYTPSGQARIAVLEESDLDDLMNQCVVAIHKLRIRRDRDAGRL